MTCTQLLTRLVDAEPVRLAALESFVGRLRSPDGSVDLMSPLFRPAPCALVEAVTVVFPEVDLYHQEPRTTGDPGFAAYRLAAPSGRRALEEHLRGKRGAPAPLANGPTAVLRFGPFYLSAAPLDAVDLAWCAAPPAFALPVPAPRPPRNPAALRRFLEGLPSAVAALASMAAADRFRHQVPPEAGVVTEQRFNRDRFSLRFHPPVGARELCAALRWERPIAASTDVHQSSWSVFLAAEPLASGPVDARRPTFGTWEVAAELAPGFSAGLAVPPASFGPSPAYDLSACDGPVVRLELAAGSGTALDTTSCPDDVRLAPPPSPGPFPFLVAVPARPPGF